MVESHSADGAEQSQVVLVGRVVAVPGHDVEGREGLLRTEQPVVELAEDCEGAAALLEAGDRGEEVPRVRQSVGACTSRNFVSVRQAAMPSIKDPKSHAFFRALVLKVDH